MKKIITLFLIIVTIQSMAQNKKGQATYVVKKNYTEDSRVKILERQFQIITNKLQNDLDSRIAEKSDSATFINETKLCYSEIANAINKFKQNFASLDTVTVYIDKLQEEIDLLNKWINRVQTDTLIQDYTSVKLYSDKLKEYNEKVFLMQEAKKQLK